MCMKKTNFRGIFLLLRQGISLFSDLKYKVHDICPRKWNDSSSNFIQIVFTSTFRFWQFHRIPDGSQTFAEKSRGKEIESAQNSYQMILWHVQLL